MPEDVFTQNVTFSGKFLSIILTYFIFKWLRELFQKKITINSPRFSKEFPFLTGILSYTSTYVSAYVKS